MIRPIGSKICAIKASTLRLVNDSDNSTSSKVIAKLSRDGFHDTPKTLLLLFSEVMTYLGSGLVSEILLKDAIYGVVFLRFSTIQ